MFVNALVQFWYKSLHQSCVAIVLYTAMSVSHALPSIMLQHNYVTAMDQFSPVTIVGLTYRLVGGKGVGICIYSTV